MYNTIDILKLLDISLPSPSINDILNRLHLLPFYIEYSLAQSKRYHQMICLDIYRYMLRAKVKWQIHSKPNKPKEDSAGSSLY